MTVKEKVIASYKRAWSKPKDEPVLEYLQRKQKELGRKKLAEQIGVTPAQLSKVMTLMKPKNERRFKREECGEDPTLQQYNYAEDLQKNLLKYGIRGLEERMKIKQKYEYKAK